MALGFTTAAANSALTALFAAYPWVKMHIGAPGSGGTDSPAIETTRKQVEVSVASGAATSSSPLAWAAVAATETWTHVSGWSAETGGSCGWTGEMVAPVAATAGDNVTVASGDFDAALSVAS